MDFNALRLADAGQLTAQWATDHAERIRDYLDDHLLGKPGILNDISYWTGPMLPQGHGGYPVMRESLLRAFVTTNVFRQSIEHLAEAITGLENWQLAEDGQRREDQARTEDEEVLTTWWDREGIEGLLDQFKVRLTAHGRAVMRPVLSARALERRDGSVRLRPAATLTEALSRIRVRLPDVTQAGIYEDEDTLDLLSVYSYSVRGRQELELSWVLEDGRTVLKLLRGQEAPQVAVLPLGGRHWMVEARLPRGVASLTLLANQDALGVSDTMLNRNTHYAGYVETYAIGIAPPGQWQLPDGTVVPEGTEGAVWVPQPVITGPATRNFYQAASRNTLTEDAQGNKTQSATFSPASMDRFTPVDPVSIQAGIERFEGNIYREARQAFMQMADDATASGRSREVAAGSFLRGGGKIKRATEGAVRDLLELVLAIASLMLPEGQRERYRTLRAVVQARVQPFTPSTEERAQNREDYLAGGIDLDTYMLGTGLVTDADATKRKIQAARAEQLALTGGGNPE